MPDQLLRQYSQRSSRKIKHFPMVQNRYGQGEFSDLKRITSSPNDNKKHTLPNQYDAITSCISTSQHLNYLQWCCKNKVSILLTVLFID